MIHRDFDPYSSTAAAPDQQTHHDASGEPVPDQNRQLGVDVPLSVSPAKPVIAERIKWKLGPTFNPEPFLVDPVVQAAFKDPDVLRKPATDWPAKRKSARVHCDRAELKKLAEKWDKLGACALIPVHCVPEDEAVGLFAVNKASEYDRLIVNPTVVNSRMYGCNTYTKTLAPGHLIGLIRLHADECLAISSDDLCEFLLYFPCFPPKSCKECDWHCFSGKRV